MSEVNENVQSSGVPNLVIIGNTAYDTKEYSLNGKIREKDVGGACLYSAIPASLFARVGIVTKIGEDFDINQILKYNIDFSGIKRVHGDTTHFYTKFLSDDGQISVTYGDVADNMIINYEDIPKKFLQAKNIHFTTSEPKHLLKMIKEVKKNSNAILSADTNSSFANMPETKEIFDIVDIAFIDREFTGLLNCNARIKIIKLGSSGCIFKSAEEVFAQDVKIKEVVVDKLGAGDCLNGVFINLFSNGTNSRLSLKKATEIATESIDDYGILGLKDDIERGR